VNQEIASKLTQIFASLPADDEVSHCVLLFGALIKDAELADLALKTSHEHGLEGTLACEAVLQSFLFAGFPRCINGLESFRRHYGADACLKPTRKEEAKDIERFRERGEELFRKIYGENTEVVMAALDRYHGELKDWILVDAYGKILARPELSAKVRELCAVIGLLVSGDTRQLSSHIRGALHCGAKTNEIDAAIDLVSFLYSSERQDLAHTLVAKIAKA
jgi:4-carboxymuconolactone decarboxylase